MKWTRIKAIIRREWTELRRNRLVVATMTVLPLAIVLSAVGTSAFLASVPDSEFRSDIPAHFAPELRALDGGREALMGLVVDQFLYMLLLIALALPSTIAAHAIVGEKVERTLEPLLATPVATNELLFAKCLAAVIPATIMTQIAYAVTVVGLTLTCPYRVLALAVRAVWPVAFLLLVPILASLSATVALIASSRVNDARTAQGLVGFLVVPVIGMGVSTIVGRLFLDIPLLLTGAFLAALLDVLILYFAVKVFSREAILTRWR